MGARRGQREGLPCEHAEADVHTAPIVGDYGLRVGGRLAAASTFTIDGLMIVFNGQSILWPSVA